MSNVTQNVLNLPKSVVERWIFDSAGPTDEERPAPAEFVLTQAVEKIRWAFQEWAELVRSGTRSVDVPYQQGYGYGLGKIELPLIMSHQEAQFWLKDC